MKKIILAGMVLGFLGFLEYSYQKSVRENKDAVMVFDPEFFEDEDLEALVNWGQTELMGRWANEKPDA